MKILADATIPGLVQAFPQPFELTVYKEGENIAELLSGQDILLCRATLKVNEQLLKGHSLRYVATASSGTDHIDSAYLKMHAITLLDAKGSNAVAVADYVIATLAYLQRDHSFQGTKAGLIGVGEVGSKVKERLAAANMEVLCYDPPKSKRDTNFYSITLTELADCDLICVHASLHEEPPYPSRNLINAALLKRLKPGCVIINASRGGIIDEKALLQTPSVIYCTDVYNNEPFINPEIVNFSRLCTPHIAGHSIEAKYAAVFILSQKLHTCYDLSPPTMGSFLATTANLPPLPETQSWQDCVLSLFNPVVETNLLKNSSNLAATFTELRKAHKNRHDFCVYNAQLVNQQTRNILGFNNTR
ncbi:erythronate-4-phosphate dehydrogenase [Legionella donaldsonii]|uniref:Erythronate-4-phosphate dehydrogenase n=1 Tax=Legionella donaldsonii TaxID=45060 RepID=A0A378J692_9GAMM|nr:4-phosphoerythronate dehydrogenase [Legionella donaldsonii]STX43135.1 erythronate-4-phosphate dehydrogenase [Legionella donaldsonii]